MRGGIFLKMTPAKQVDFMTRVAKSPLGLDGMKIVVMCDKARDIIFDTLGKEMLQTVTGKTVQEKYGEKEGKKIAELLRVERIAWLKQKAKQ